MTLGASVDCFFTADLGGSVFPTTSFSPSFGEFSAAATFGGKDAGFVVCANPSFASGLTA